LNRKGLGAEAWYNNGSQNISAAVSSPRGTFATNTFSGIVGFQGPYRLIGTNGERNILIVAGTERIYVNGTEMKRGEDADYRIDYSTGEVYFMPRRYIDQYSRIAVDFEYTSESYARSLVSTSAATTLFNDHITFGVSYLRQADDPDAPRYFSLSDDDKKVIASAGFDSRASSRSGVRNVGRDSSGRARGTYVRIDSGAVFYRFQPSDTVNALYNVTFGYVGSGGNYRRNTSLDYYYVGSGRGDYDTILLLPMPLMQQTFGASTGVRLFDSSLSLNGEYIRSDLTPNRLSTLSGITGSAYQAVMTYRDSISLLMRSILDVSVRSRSQDSSFSSPERILSPDALRKYGIDDTTDLLQSYLTNDLTEHQINTRLGTRWYMIGASYGSMSSKRRAVNAENLSARFDVYESGSWLPSLSISHQYIPSELTSLDQKSRWYITSIQASRTLSVDSLRVVPQFSFNRTGKSETDAGMVSTRSFRTSEIAGGLQLRSRAFSSLLQLAYFTDDSSRAGRYEHISNNYRMIVTSSLLTSRAFSVNAEIGYTMKQYDDSVIRMRNGGDRNMLTAQIIPRLSIANGGVKTDIRYGLVNELSSRIERLFFETQPGYGTYRYLGDLNGNNVKDPNEFELARYSDQANYVLITRPSESLYPTTNVSTSVVFDIKPSAFLPKDHLLSVLSASTQLRIEEKSRAERASDVFLLKPKFLLNDSTTLEGRIEWSQELMLFDDDIDKNFRLRYDVRRSLGNYTTGAERRRYQSLSLRSHLQLLTTLAADNVISLSQDNTEAAALSIVRSGSVRQFSSQLDLRFVPLFEPTNISLRTSYTDLKDQRSDDRSQILTVMTQLHHRLSEPLGFTIEAGAVHLSLASTKNYFLLPYQMTDGRDPGFTLQWGMSAEYQISDGVTAVADYKGRSNKEALLGQPTVHTVRMDFRATF
jgi:hypothetical protein